MMTTPSRSPAAPSAHPPGLTAENVGKRFGTVQALRGIDLNFPPGQVTALMGENGAGSPPCCAS
ncbi:hypothetical protein O1L60_33760 [Streptomyces diastatochromogenes]|nr:hypothetical protein [Streptomyces diastatochromogenes]